MLVHMSVLCLLNGRLKLVHTSVLCLYIYILVLCACFYNIIHMSVRKCAGAHVPGVRRSNELLLLPL